jgi:hypothetical protein
MEVALPLIKTTISAVWKRSIHLQVMIDLRAGGLGHPEKVVTVSASYRRIGHVRIRQ